jgi:hypothetical protein
MEGQVAHRAFRCHHRKRIKGYERELLKITEHEAAAAALAVTQSPLLAAASSNVPDLDQTPARRASQ